LGQDVHQLAVEADAGPLPGQWGANQDQPKTDEGPADDETISLLRDLVHRLRIELGAELG
jgi:hypothetical protein